MTGRAGPRGQGDRRIAIVGAILMLVVSLGGCTATPGSAASAPSANIPPSGGSPTPGSSKPTPSVRHQREADFKAAASAYREGMAEVNRLMLAGGTSKATALMLRTMNGPYLKFEFAELQQQRRVGEKYSRKSKHKVVFVRPIEQEADTIRMDACLDSRSIKSSWKMGDRTWTRSGWMSRVEIKAKKINGKWLIDNSRWVGSVASCEGLP